MTTKTHIHAQMISLMCEGRNDLLCATWTRQCRKPSPNITHITTTLTGTALYSKKKNSKYLTHPRSVIPDLQTS
jgi:hypothetical protein